MRWCPYCKKEVNTKMTGGQIAALIVLLMVGMLPGLLYAICHAKKCPYCLTPTVAIVGKNNKHSKAKK